MKTESTAIPKDKFPSEWFKNRDRDKEKYDQTIKIIKTSNVTSFFNEIKDRELPTTADVDAASQKVTENLKNRILSDDLITLLNGGTLSDQQDLDDLAMHTRELLPVIHLPNPLSVQTTIRTVALCINATLGTIAGLFLGGFCARLMSIPAESGMLVGAILGTFLLAWLSLFTANNPKVRKTLLILLGVTVATDAGLQFVKEMIPLPFGKSRFGFIQRLIGYAIAAWAVWMLKPRKTYDSAHYRQEVETIVEQWINASVSIILVLLYRMERELENSVSDGKVKEELTRTRKIIHNLVHIAAQTMRDPENERLDGLSLMVQELQNAGFVISDNTTSDTKSFVWEEATGEQYETFGLIEPGTEVVIMKYPIIQNGIVIKQGMVKKVKK